MSIADTNAGDPVAAKTDADDDSSDQKFDEHSENAIYEGNFEAPNCSDSDIIECFKINYEDELKCKKINDDDKNYRIFRSNSKHAIKKINGVLTNLQVFNVEILNKQPVKNVIELFKTDYMFDHKAFKNNTEDKFVKLKKIKRIE